MSSNLSDHQLKIDYYIHRLLYMNLMVTTNQKPVKDIQEIKRKGYKHKTKETIKSQGKTEEQAKRTTTKKRKRTQ